MWIQEHCTKDDQVTWLQKHCTLYNEWPGNQEGRKTACQLKQEEAG